MKRIVEVISALVLVFIYFGINENSIAQSMDWNSFIQMNQNQSPLLSDWQRDPTIGTLTLSYFGNDPVKFKFNITISIPGFPEAIKGVTNEFEFAGGPTTHIFNFSDIADWDDVTINSELEKTVMQSGKLPEAEYTVCVQTISLTKEVLTETCTNFEIQIPNPPELISPEDEGSIELAQPTFIWNSVTVSPDVFVYYNLKLVQILEGQNKYRAIQSNIPVLEKEIINSNIYLYEIDNYPLENNYSYAWQIQALNDEGVPVSTNEGYSEVFSFTYGSAASELNVDTLEIVKDFAYLVDLNQLSVINNEAYYTLDGITTLLLKKADGTDALLDANVQNLMVQNFGDDQPELIGGNIDGDIVDDFFPTELTGEYFRPRSFDFQIPGQLQISGVLDFGTGNEIPLSGNLLYENGSLSGELFASANDGTSIFEFGDDLLQYHISSALIKFPETEIDLTGGFAFFNQMPSVLNDEFSISNDGDFSINIESDNPIEIPLYAASDFIKLIINNYNGTITGNLKTQKFDYSIFSNDLIQFNANENNSFGADLEIIFNPGQMKIVSFSTSGEFENNYVDLGWLKFKMNKMKLNQLSFENKEWDFDFSFDAAFNFPDFSNKDFPKLSDVSLTKKGFTFPAFEFDSFSIPDIDFAGFVLEIYGLRSDEYTLDLGSWTPGSIAGFSFNFDANLTMPNFPAGSSKGFFENGIKISPKLTGGKFNFNIPKIDLPDPLKLTIMDDFNFWVNQINGSIGSDYDGMSFAFLPDIKFKGNLSLPENLSCDDGKESNLIMKSSIFVNGNGKLSGVVDNVIPECPLNVGMFSIKFMDSKLEFNSANDQKIFIEGSAGINFAKEEGSKPIGKLGAKYDILNNDLIYLKGSIDEKFRWDIGGENPVLSFLINSASIDNNILEIDGRNSALIGSDNLGLTFDQFQINLENLNIEGGSIIFDTGFNLKISGLEDNNFKISTLPKEAKLGSDEGVMLTLPDQIIIDKNGIGVTGNASAEINFNGKNYTDINVDFSKDLTFDLEKFTVKTGQVDFKFKGNRIAYWNSEGLIPDLSFFMNYIIPDKIPLPTLDIAYLQVKRNDSLLVRVVPEGDNLTISTFEGKPLPLVFTGLQFGKPLPPQVNTSFELTINTNSEEVTGGSIFIQVPEEFRSDFDLSQIGIPFQVYSIYYGLIEGEYGFRLTGKAKLFETELACVDSSSLQITNNGNLIGAAVCDLNTTIPMVPGSDKLNLILNHIAGQFDVDLLAQSIDFDFELDSDIKFRLNENEDWGVWTLLGFTPDGIEFRDSRVDSIGIPKIELPNFELGISNLSLPALSYTEGLNGGWNFEFGMDIELTFPQFNFTVNIPGDRGMSLTKSGFHFPNISVGELPDSLMFEMNGFSVHPSGFRFPQIDFNWFDPASSETDWNFAFDLDVNLPKVNGDLRRLSFSNVNFTGGIFIGEFPEINFDPGALILPMGNGLDFNITGINSNFFSNDGNQGIDFKFKGKLRMPQFASCQNEDGTIYDIADTEFSFGSSGFLSGRIERFAPTCPIDVGIGKFNITSSSLEFSANDSSQSAIIDMRGALNIPTGGQDTVTASGLLVMDLISGELIDGEVRVDDQFVFNLPKEKPVFKFTINSAVYNKDGLAISGDNQLLLAGGNTLPVRFNNFKFDPIKFKVLSGSISIQDSVALKFKFEDEGIAYSLAPYNYSLNETRTAMLGLKGGVTIDPTGILAQGEALAAIYWSEELNFGNLRAEFSNDFKMNFSPFGVKEGKVELFRADDLMATYDNGGLRLEDIFGVLPLPERIPLPMEDIAYIQIRDGENTFVQTNQEENGLRISTRDGSPVKLRIPGLKYNGVNVPEFNVTFNLVINLSDRRIIDGEILLLPGENELSLFDLGNFGIPAEIMKIRFGKNAENIYALTTKIKFNLPSALGNLNVELDEVEIGRNGLSGNLTAGRYSLNYPDREIHALTFADLGTNAAITLEGIEGSFGADKVFKFSGKFIPKLFVSDGDTSLIHYSAEWNEARHQFMFALDLAEGQNIEMGIAEFVPTPLGGLPAMQLQFTNSPNSDLALILNGRILFNSFGNANQFSLDFKNMRISKNNFSVEDLSIPNFEQALSFNLFKSNFKIYDVIHAGVNYPGISFTYLNGRLKLNLAGELEFFSKKITFANLGIDTDGNFSMPDVDFLTSDLVIIDNFLTLNKIRLNNNKLEIGGSAKLPKPASDDNHFDFNFKINADGTLEEINESEFVFIDETRGGLNNDDSEYPFWIGNFDARYLSLSLDFENILRSNIKMVADVYFNDDAIGIGSRGIGSISPGFTVDFTVQTQ